MNEFNHHKAKKNIKKQLKDADWELQTFEVGDIQVMIYLYDHFDTRELMMAGLRKTDINSLSKMIHPMDTITGAVEGAFQNYISPCSDIDKKQRTEVLGSSLGLYMVNTQTYKSLMKTECKPGYNRHFIVLRYKNKNTNVSNLRPFSLLNKSKVLTPEEVYEMTHSIIERDENKNASFFGFNPVYEFKK